MSNVPGLTEYMLSGRWEQELNKENPLGMKGEIAISFAELIREMWSGMRAYTVPRNFKVPCLLVIQERFENVLIKKNLFVRKLEGSQ